MKTDRPVSILSAMVRGSFRCMICLYEGVPGAQDGGYPTVGIVWVWAHPHEVGEVRECPQEVKLKRFADCSNLLR